jgi:hypothetical protein
MMTQVSGETMHLLRLATAIAAAASLAAWGGRPRARPIRDVTATVRYVSIEGGFFALQGDDGVTYDPRRLDRKFAHDGLRVRARLHVLHDAAGVHMVGPIVDVLRMSKLPR